MPDVAAVDMPRPIAVDTDAAVPDPRAIDIAVAVAVLLPCTVAEASTFAPPVALVGAKLALVPPLVAMDMPRADAEPVPDADAWATAIDKPAAVALPTPRTVPAEGAKDAVAAPSGAPAMG